MNNLPVAAAQLNPTARTPFPGSTSISLPQGVRQPMRQARRSISPEAGRAIEKLAHAIEYLTDEYVHDRGYLNTEDSRMQAVQLLMQLNREVYFHCPIVPTFGERCRTFFTRFASKPYIAHTH